MYMSMKMEMKYVAPEVEIVETLVEVGFAGSVGENETGGNFGGGGVNETPDF